MSGYRIEVADRVATLTLDRPPLNILDIATCRALAGEMTGLAANGDVGVLVLAGAGRAFSAGVDIGEHRAPTAAASLEAFHLLARAVLEFPRPTVARVHGDALGGGCELVLCCDLAIAAAGARLGLPEITLGVFPPLAAAILPRFAGRRAAAEAILWGEPLPADRALALGLVSEVVPVTELDRRVAERSARAAGLSGAALRQAKRALLVAEAGTFAAALQAAERIYLEETARSADAEEGLAAFLAKRPPAWRHR